MYVFWTEEGKVVVMAELTGSVTRDTGEVMRMSMAEVFVMRSGKIAERSPTLCPLGTVERHNRR